MPRRIIALDLPLRAAPSSGAELLAGPCRNLLLCGPAGRPRPAPFWSRSRSLPWFLGEALRRQRRRSEARAHLRNALEVFEKLGTAPWTERARAELRASGETARRHDPNAFDQLTPQEVRIALFASKGASNPDIAAQLFLSRRTVEYLLHKVFTKLVVTSRAELATVDLQIQ